MAKVKCNKNRRISWAKVDFISLCKKGANTISTMYKADDGISHNIELSTLSKDMDEQGELICCVYAPDMVDSDGDTASAEVIKKFAYGFAQNGAGIDIRHNEEVLSKEAIFVAETMIIQDGDPRFADMEDAAKEVVAAVKKAAEKYGASIPVY